MIRTSIQTLFGNTGVFPGDLCLQVHLRPERPRSVGSVVAPAPGSVHVSALRAFKANTGEAIYAP